MTITRWLAGAAVAASLTACVAEGPADDPTATTTLTPPAGATTTTRPEGEAPPSLADVDVELLELTGGLDDPVVVAARSGTANLYVAQRGGRIRVIERQVKVDAKTGIRTIGTERLSSSTVLDLSDEVGGDGLEQGLLGMTFSSDGSRLYVAYTGRDRALHVVEHAMRPLEDRASSSDRRTLLRIEQPAENHNGGSLVFGADGFLYVGVGDGGGQGDPFGNARDPDSLLGSLLRLDPDVLRVGEDPPPYEIPSGNPFADGADGRPEVWLKGVQDPWRFSFDPATGDLWIADTGGEQREEITRLQARNGTGRGADLGWDLVEGTVPTGGDEVPPEAKPPIYEYAHDDACRVVGGYVYRGDRIEGLGGAYLFGDRCNGRLQALRPLEDGGVEVQDLGIGVGRDELVAFGRDDDGELYVVTSGGQLLRLQAAS